MGLAVLQAQKRYHVFDEGTMSRFIKIIKDLRSYTVEGPNRSKSLDIFYDSKEKILQQNNLLLRKRVLGNKAFIKLKRLTVSPQFFYADALRNHEREKEVAAKDPLSAHFFFLNNALNSMYSSSLKFDPDKLFAKMEVSLTIDIARTSYTVFGPNALKMEISSEILQVHNLPNKRKNKTEFIQIQLKSAESTLPYFEDFVTRIEKYCKEIMFTTDSRYDVAVRITQPLPTKEELKAQKLAKAKAKSDEEAFT